MFIRLNKIKISKGFKKHPPKWEKIQEKMIYRSVYGTYKEKVMLDKKNNILLDGYTTYLLAKNENKKFLWVKKV